MTGGPSPLAAPAAAPRLLVVTERRLFAAGPDRFSAVAAAVRAAAGVGPVDVWLRDSDLSPTRRRDLGRTVADALTGAATGSRLVVGVRRPVDLDLADELDAWGLQLSAAWHGSLGSSTRPFGRSCRDAAEVERAAREGASWATLSPVFATTRGRGTALGPEALGGHGLPVLGLGGITDADQVRRCLAAGARGIAVRRALGAIDPARAVGRLLEGFGEAAMTREDAGPDATGRRDPIRTRLRRRRTTDLDRPPAPPPDLEAGDTDPGEARTPSHLPVACTITGSDPGPGGLATDLATFSAAGVHGAAVVTALSVHGHHGLSAVHVPPIAGLHAQLDAVLRSFGLRATKVGALTSPAVLEAVIDRAAAGDLPQLVVDPELVVGLGGLPLLERHAVDRLLLGLLPLALVTTPDVSEAAALLDRPVEEVRTRAGQRAAAVELAHRLGLAGASAGALVVVTGGRTEPEGGHVVDLAVDVASGGVAEIAVPVVEPRAHLDTGRSYAAAVAAALANGGAPVDAAHEAARTLHAARVRASIGSWSPRSTVDLTTR